MPRTPAERKPAAGHRKSSQALAANFLRIRLGLKETQAQFAKRLRIVQTQVSEVEQGGHNPKLHSLDDWAYYLDIDVCDLLRPPEQSGD